MQRNQNNAFMIQTNPNHSKNMIFQPNATLGAAAEKPLQQKKKKIQKKKKKHIASTGGKNELFLWLRLDEMNPEKG